VKPRNLCPYFQSLIRAAPGKRRVAGNLTSPPDISSKETAVPTRIFERITLAQLLVGCAVVFGLIELAQAQPGYVPPPTPLPPPVLNPSNPGTVPQPSYKPLTPSTSSTVPSSEVTPPANEEPSTARSERRATRSVHHHYRGRHTGVGPSMGSFDCSYGWCVRISPSYAYHRPYGWYR